MILSRFASSHARRGSAEASGRAAPRDEHDDQRRDATAASANPATHGQGDDRVEPDGAADAAMPFPRAAALRSRGGESGAIDRIGDGGRGDASVVRSASGADRQTTTRGAARGAGERLVVFAVGQRGDVGGPSADGATVVRAVRAHGAASAARRELRARSAPVAAPVGGKDASRGPLCRRVYPPPLRRETIFFAGTNPILSRGRGPVRRARGSAASSGAYSRRRRPGVSRAGGLRRRGAVRRCCGVAPARWRMRLNSSSIRSSSSSVQCSRSTIVLRPALAADQLIELEMDRLGVAVLRVLDQEDHQERDDRRAGVDHELPRIGELKIGRRSPTPARPPRATKNDQCEPTTALADCAKRWNRCRRVLPPPFASRRDGVLRGGQAALFVGLILRGT